MASALAFGRVFDQRILTPDDLPVIEKKMKEIIQRNSPFTKQVWSRDKARQVFADKGESYKVELVDTIPAGQDLKIYSRSFSQNSRAPR